MRQRVSSEDLGTPRSRWVRTGVALTAAALLAAGCGNSLTPADAAGEPAPAMETRVEGLELPENAERIQVVADSDQRSIAHYRLEGADLEEVVDFHLEELPDRGWEEESDRRAETEVAGQPARRLHFGREPWQTPEGVDSLRFRLTVEVVEDGDDVRLIWTVVDQQAVRAGA